MRKNILILTPFPPDGIGGAETFVKELVKEAKKENEVIVCTLKERKKAWKGVGIGNLFSVFPMMLWRCTLALLKNKPDIIHAQGLISGLVAVLLKKIFKVKVFVTLLALYEFSSRSKCFKQVSYFILNNCDLVFVEGENGKQDLGKFGRIEKEKIKVFNHWVDSKRFNNQNRFKDDTIKDKIRVLFIGRPIPEKGRQVVEMAERLINNPKYEFTYVDNVPYEELPKYYQMADIVVVPSLYAEGYCRVVAEGASCGCAIITSNRGSLPEMVKGWGSVIEYFNEDMMSQELVKIIKNICHNETYKRLQETALIYAKEKFSINNADVFLREYKGI